MKLPQNTHGGNFEIDPEYLELIKDNMDAEYQIGLEEIEAVLLALVDLGQAEFEHE